MRQLPRAGDTENGELDQGPSDDTSVCGFGLVAELGFAFLQHYVSISIENDTGNLLCACTRTHCGVMEGDSPAGTPVLS
jgi:hypothetical protein